MYRKKRRSIYGITFLLLSVFGLNAQERIFLMPGIKFSKSFGENAETIFGIDVSVFVINNKDNMWAVNATYDFGTTNPQLTFGYEFIAPYLPIGISIGPAWETTTNNIGLYGAVFLPLFFTPMFQYTLYFDKLKSLTEFGCFAKIPIKIGGTKKGDFDLGPMNMFK